MFKNLAPGGIGIQANIHESLELAKSAGFGGTDLNIVEASTLAQTHSIEYVKELWSEAGLEMGAWGLEIDWRATGAAYYESLSRFANFAQLAADLGCYRCTSALRVGRMNSHFKTTGIFTLTDCVPPRRF